MISRRYGYMGCCPEMGADPVPVTPQGEKPTADQQQAAESTSSSFWDNLFGFLTPGWGAVEAGITGEREPGDTIYYEGDQIAPPQESTIAGIKTSTVLLVAVGLAGVTGLYFALR